MTIETLGVDIAKTVFQLHGVSRNGRVVLKRWVMRDQLLAVIAQIEACTIAIEACTGAFYWQRKFEAFDHKVRIISPQCVKPFVRRQKNDGGDAEAICTAARQACGSFRRRLSSSRISRRFTEPASVWSIIERPWSARSAGCCWIEGSRSQRASPVRVG
jgi:transposase